MGIIFFGENPPTVSHLLLETLQFAAAVLIRVYPCPSVVQKNRSRKRVHGSSCSRKNWIVLMNWKSAFFFF